MPEVRDHYIGTEILLPRGDKMARGHAVVPHCNANGNVMGRAHTNPVLNTNTRTYEVELPGGKVTELTANIIAESMYAQCDADRNEYLLLDALVDYHKDNKAISLTEQQTSIQGRPVTGKTITGCQICCKWNDGSTLSKLKEPHPMWTAEFAVVQEIDHKPALNRWVKHVLKKRESIWPAMFSIIFMTTITYQFQSVPTGIRHA